ncbi:unnamed protein product [Brassica oleracea var. botrytis]
MEYEDMRSDSQVRSSYYHQNKHHALRSFAAQSKVKGRMRGRVKLNLVQSVYVKFVLSWFIYVNEKRWLWKLMKRQRIRSVARGCK